MASSVVKSLRAEINKAERQLHELTERIEHLRYTLAYYEQQDQAGDELQPAKAVRNAIHEILVAEGRPLYYKEIYQRLQQREIAVRGENPASNVIAHMSGDTRFKNVGRGMWGLTQWHRNASSESIGESTPNVVNLHQPESQEGAATTVRVTPAEPPWLTARRGNTNHGST